MADLFDRFVGSAGLLTGHVPDAPSALTWGPSGTQISLSGSGSVYAPAPIGLGFLAFPSWTPPGTDYGATAVFGADFRNLVSGDGAGVALRATGSDLNNWNAYAIYFSWGSSVDTLTIGNFAVVSGSLTTSNIVGATQNLASQVQAGDSITATITGTSPPQITVFHNGMQIYQISDTVGPAITGAGSAGLIISEGDTGDNSHQDIIRTLFAGTIGDPASTITPSSVSVALSGTHSFTAATLLTNESITWTATHGSISGSLATETYTAPGTGSTDAVTWTSTDLPLHTATAAITLTGGTATTYTLSLSAASGPEGTAVVATVTPDANYTGSITLTPSGGGLSTPQTLTFSGTSSGQTASFTPTATGTLTITGTNSGSLTNPSAATYTVLTLVPVNSSGLYFSKNFSVSGSSYAITNAPGAYLKTTFTGTAAKLLVDTSVISGLDSSATPMIRYSVDGAKPTVVQLGVANGIQTITLATGLASGSHYLFVSVQNTNVNSANRWNDALNTYAAVKITGLIIDATASVSVTPLPKQLLILGDSITEAFDNIAGDQSQASQDAGQSFGIFMAHALDAEAAVVGWSSQGYLITGNGAVPTFPNSWDKFSTNVSRLSGGSFVFPPDFILVAEGLNDAQSATSIQSTVQSVLSAIRTAAPSAWILHAQPFYSGLDGGADAAHVVARRSEILAAAAAFAGTATTVTLGDGSSYTTFGTDTKVAVLDTGGPFGLGFSYPPEYGSGTRWTLDDIHPSVEGHAQIATRLGNLARLAIGGGGSSSTVFSPLGSGFIRGV